MLGVRGEARRHRSRLPRVYGRDRGARSVQGRRHGGEQRTLNMEPMLVTLEVSQLRGWLKARASCRGLQAGQRCGAG